MCAEGAKLVVLITGLCPASCFYCPLSMKKQGKDVIYADEWKLKNEKDTEKLLLESEYIKATGAGITGGDPLLVWRRTQKYIALLKENFGKSFHVHLYTSGVKNTGHIITTIEIAAPCLRPCGDGICQEYENWCTCEQDCDKSVGAVVLDCEHECIIDSDYPTLVWEQCNCEYYTNPI